jgi:hypothetical protein
VNAIAPEAWIKPSATPVCGSCGYDLGGLHRDEVDRCPECGSNAHARAWPGWWPVVLLCAAPAWGMWLGILFWPTLFAAIPEQLDRGVLATLVGAAVLWSVAAPVAVGWRFGVLGCEAPHRPNVRAVIWRTALITSAGNLAILGVWLLCAACVVAGTR